MYADRKAPYPETISTPLISLRSWCHWSRSYYAVVYGQTARGRSIVTDFFFLQPTPPANWDLPANISVLVKSPRRQSFFLFSSFSLEKLPVDLSNGIIFVTHSIDHNGGLWTTSRVTKKKTFKDNNSVTEDNTMFNESRKGRARARRWKRRSKTKNVRAGKRRKEKKIERERRGYRQQTGVWRDSWCGSSVVLADSTE